MFKTRKKSQRMIRAELVISVLVIVIAVAMDTAFITGADSASTTKGTQAAQPEKFALLIGINDYQYVDKLHGAVQDVTDMKNLLTSNKFGFRFPNDPQHIKVLTDKAATRENILKAFRTQLIDNAKKHPDAWFVFHYCGHGSRVKDVTRTEPDGWNETIVPVDSRDPEGKHFDIRDKELAPLFQELARYSSNTLLIFDSCHSGAVLRGTLRAREVPPDGRAQPALDLPAGTKHIRDLEKFYLVPPNPDRYVAIFGCKPTEKAYEMEVRRNGALSYYLIEALKRAGPKTTFRDLVNSVARSVSHDNPNQHPRAEGNLSRQIFDGKIIEEDSFITISALNEKDKLITIDAGESAGIKIGTMLAVYDAKQPKLSGMKGWLGNATVTQVSPTSANALITEKWPAGLMTDSKVVALSPLFGAQKMKVAVERGTNSTAAPTDTASGTIAEIDQRLRDNLLLEFVGYAEPLSNASAKSALDKSIATSEAIVRRGKFGWVFQNARPAPVKDKDGKEIPLPDDQQEVYYIAPGGGDPIFDRYWKVEDPQASEKIVDALEKLARQRNLIALENASSTLNSGIKLTVLKVTVQVDPVTKQPKLNAKGEFLPEKEEPLTVDDRSQDLSLDPGTMFRLQIENHSDTDEVYVSLFDISTDGTIARMFPGRLELNDKPLVRNRPFKTRVFRITPPAGTEVFKVIATNTPADYSFLEQGAAKRAPRNPFEILASQALKGPSMRGIADGNVASVDAWATVQLTVTVTRK